MQIKSEKLWTRYSKEGALNIDHSFKEPILSVQLQKKNSLTKQTIKYFQFFSDRMLYFLDKSFQNCRGELLYSFDMIIEWIYLGKILNDKLPPLIGFKLKTPKAIVSFYSSNEAEMDQIYQFLKTKIYQQNIHYYYKALQKIGKGNFAIVSVYLLQNKQDGQLYAAKFFNKALHYNKPQGKQAIEKEITILREIDHSNILKLYEIYETDHSLYLITNFLQGDSLLQYLKATRPLSINTSKYFILQLLQIQTHLNTKGIMHRDLKPENLILENSSSEKIVLIDFGLAEKVNIGNYLFPRCGTPGYVAPEIANNKDQSNSYGCECDIFSIGCIMHLIFVGKQLFQGKTHLEVLNANKACNFDVNNQIYERLSPDARDLLWRLLEINPSKRITAADALAHEFFNSSSSHFMSPNSNYQQVQMNYLKQNCGESPQSNEDYEPDYQPNIEESYALAAYQIPCFQSIQSSIPIEQFLKCNEESKTDKSQTSASINQESLYQQFNEVQNNPKLLKTFQPPQKLSTSPFIQFGINQQQQQLLNLNNQLAFQFLSNQKNQNSKQNSQQNTLTYISPIFETKQIEAQAQKMENYLAQQIPIMSNHPFQQFQVPVKMQTSPLIKIQEEQEQFLKNEQQKLNQIKK